MTRETTHKDAILIAGPTASGKSGVALRLAEELGGVIINTDSMQVYDGLRVLTARPSVADEARVPHRLYGIIDPSVRCSVGIWAGLVQDCLASLEEDQTPIFVGGTGLYFSVLTDGLSQIPDVSAEVQGRVQGLHDDIGLEHFAGLVAESDPGLVERVGRTDPQRLIRAMAVFEETGRPLSDWQKEPKRPILKGEQVPIVLDPDRDWLYARCNLRFEQMLEEGALEEVAALLARKLDPMLPAMKALGMPELCGLVRGEIPQETAVLEAQKQTRRFAKRQYTWFRNQMIAWNRVSQQQSETLFDEIFTIICDSGLTR